MLLYFFQPRVDIQEGFFVAQIENNDNSIGSLVISVRDCTIALLPGGVPNLQLNCAFIDLKSAETEVHTDCCNVVLRETIVSESYQQARLAHTSVTDEDQLEKVIAISKKFRLSSKRMTRKKCNFMV
jgi:hypothetical protein